MKIFDNYDEILLGIFTLLGFSFYILSALKMFGIINWSWWIISAFIWIPIVIKFITSIITYMIKKD